MVRPYLKVGICDIKVKDDNMKLRFKKILATLTVASLLLSMNVFADEKDAVNESSGQFNVFVEDIAGEAITSANVYVYSFTDDEIVASGITDSAGECNLYYMPKFDEEDRTTAYRDFLIYVQKDGYISGSWDLTKFYDMDDTNETEFIIRLDLDNQLSTQAVNSELSADMMEYISTQPELPFYVIRGTSLNNATTLSETDNSTFWNEEIPLGYFHVCKGATLTVAFSTSDKICVESGVKNEFGTFSIQSAGSRRREFETKTTFPEYTTTSSGGRKRLYSTSGTFEMYTTVDGAAGRLNTHYVLDSVIGGTILGGNKGCSSCNAPYEDVATDYGNYLPIVDGGSSTLAQINGTTLDFGLSIPLTEVGLTYSLGVKVETTSKTDLTYTPQDGYNIALYDVDRSKETWHVTSETA